MSLMLRLIGHNIPLWKCGGYTEERLAEEKRFGGVGFSLSGKNVDNIVNAIVNGLSHPDVVTLLVKEFAALPSIIRINLTDACNKTFGVRSGNKTKGISRANELLEGKLLREERLVQTVQRRRVINGEVGYESRRVNQAVAGAERLYANTALPANFNSLSKRDKKRAQREVNQVRREERRGRK